MEKLNISIGILTWKRLDILRQTLNSYKERGLLNISDDITIFFNEIGEEEIKLAKEFGLRFLGNKENIGIQNAYRELVGNAKYEYFLFLENDWYLIENNEIVSKRLKAGILLLKNNDAQVVRYRHRTTPGYPCGILWRNKKHPEQTPKEDLAFVPSISDNPCSLFKEITHKKIEGEDYYFVGAQNTYWTNNPCLFKTDFVKSLLNINFKLPEKHNNGNIRWAKRYATSIVNIALEDMMQEHWRNTSNITSLSPGLFTHLDYIEDFKPHFKYPKTIMNIVTWFIPSGKYRRYLRAKYTK